MKTVLDYPFYRSKYNGSSIPRDEFSFISARAADELERYERIYTVTGTEEAKKMALCAMADTLYYYEKAMNGGIVTSSSVGSVSSSMEKVDITPKTQARELYKAAQRYLDIYRGCY